MIFKQFRKSIPKRAESRVEEVEDKVKPYYMKAHFMNVRRSLEGERREKAKSEEAVERGVTRIWVREKKVSGDY
jgi:hypothetical protein